MHAEGKELRASMCICARARARGRVCPCPCVRDVVRYRSASLYVRQRTEGTRSDLLSAALPPHPPDRTPPTGQRVRKQEKLNRSHNFPRRRKYMDKHQKADG